MTKKYKTISEVSELLKINTHVLRYWDSKFPGLSIRLSHKKQRHFNNENIQKIKDLQNILYKDGENGKHNYSLSLANKLLNENNKNKSKFKNSNNYKENKLDIKKLINIRDSLNKLL